ncbi:MAG: hypothetical protein JWO75_1495, partial [Actinomycetia bacterium]|nr:hypothetical protein [Actinomycetes bacterium]
MPLSAEHVQSAGLDDLLVLRRDRRLRLGDRLGPRGLVVLRGVDRRQAALVQLKVGDELGVTAQHDVGAAACHVRRDRDGAEPPGLGDDHRLLLVILGVQHVVLDAAPLEHHRQDLGLLDAHRADQDRLPFGIPLSDVLHHRVVLSLRGLVDHVRLVGADHRLVGRDRDDAELVDLHELGGLGHRRTGHAS